MPDGLLGDLYVWSYSAWNETVHTTLGKLYPFQGIDTWIENTVGLRTYHVSTFCPQGHIAATLNDLLASAHGDVTASWVCDRWQEG